MIVRGYGVALERLKEKDIELVRQHRNSHTIAQYMHFRETITAEMQQQWFQSIDNIHNLYYLIWFEGRAVGLINGAQIDWEKGHTGSGGIFIWEEKLWHSEVPLLANLLMLNLATYLGLHYSYIKVLPENKRAIAYNKQLGYVLMPNQENEPNQAYVLTSADYEKRTKNIHAYIHKQYGKNIDIVVDDAQHAVTNFLMQKLKALPPEAQNNLTFIYP